MDNDSKDGSVKKIKEYCEGKVKIKSKFLNYSTNNKPVHVMEEGVKISTPK